MGLHAIKLKETLVQPTGSCKELNSYLYICGRYSLCICRYNVYTNVGNFYTFEGDLYNCGWFLYIWGKFYTPEGIYAFEGPTILFNFFLLKLRSGNLTQEGKPEWDQVSSCKQNTLKIQHLPCELMYCCFITVCSTFYRQKFNLISLRAFYSNQN